MAPDLSQICRLDADCFSDPYSEALWRSYLDNVKRFSIYLFEDAGEQVGYACFSVLMPEAELLRIGVSPDKRGLGYASRGLELAQEELSENGVERVMLEVRETNLAARKLYQNLGYINDGVRRGYYAAQADRAAEDAVLMSLNLK